MEFGHKLQTRLSYKKKEEKEKKEKRKKGKKEKNEGGVFNGATVSEKLEYCWKFKKNNLFFAFVRSH